MFEQPDDQLFGDGQPFTGAHPTNRELIGQLRAWGFTRRKEDGVHVVFRGPKGGTVRVIRSQLGRADPALVNKAAQLTTNDSSLRQTSVMAAMMIAIKHIWQHKMRCSGQLHRSTGSLP